MYFLIRFLRLIALSFIVAGIYQRHGMYWTFTDILLYFLLFIPCAMDAAERRKA